MLNEIMNILGGATIEILKVVIIGAIGVGTAYLQKKKELEVQKIGAETYNANRQLAIDIATIVEKRFNLGKVVGSKAETFEKLLLEKAPNLDKDTIDNLRELAVVELDKNLKKSDLFGASKKDLN